MLTFALTGCSDTKQNKEAVNNKKNEQINSKTTKPKPKKPIYPISLKSIKNGDINITKIQKGFSFSSAQNKPVLLAFFTSWCPPCKAEIPHLNTLQKTHKDKLEIIGVLLEDKDKKEIESFMDKYEISFKVTYGENNFKIANILGDIQAIPFMILYDRDGKYANHYVGAVLEEMLDADIKKVLK